jgi:hypothetical protein
MPEDAVEEAAFLIAVDGIVGGVDVRNDDPGFAGNGVHDFFSFPHSIALSRSRHFGRQQEPTLATAIASSCVSRHALSPFNKEPKAIPVIHPDPEGASRTQNGPGLSLRAVPGSI